MEKYADLLKEHLQPGSGFSESSKAEARRLLDLLTRRHTFRKKPETPVNGLRFGINAFTFNRQLEAAYLQPHPKSGGLLWPCGGGPEPEDGQDPLRTARRELDEEAPHFLSLGNELRPCSPALLDVHFKQSLVPSKPGEWCILTVGFCVPDNFTATGEKGGIWQGLDRLRKDKDLSLSRPAEYLHGLLRKGIAA